MHRSRLTGFVIDCRVTDLEPAATFWSGALGMPIADREDIYIMLDAGVRDLAIGVQRVDHDSRVHLDIESDDIEAEATRLESLGARRIAKVKTWWVMESPTGQRFCVTEAKHSLVDAPGATAWP